MQRVLMAVLVAALFGIGVGSAGPVAAIGGTPNPPHQFYGYHPQVPTTIDGEMAPDGSVIVAYSGAGQVVGDAVVQDGLWKITIEAEFDIVWFKLDGMAADGEFALEIGGLTPVPIEVGEAGVEETPPVEEPIEEPKGDVVPETRYRRYELHVGWNPIVYDGPGVRAASLSEQFGNAVLMRWNADRQAWDVFDPRVPNEVNGLREVGRGTSLWVKSEQHKVVELAVGDGEPGWQMLRPGWNLVTWRGYSIDPAAAFKGLLARIGGVFVYRSKTGAFQTFLPGAAPYLSNLDLLPPDLPVWVKVTDGHELEWNNWEGLDAI